MTAGSASGNLPSDHRGIAMLAVLVAIWGSSFLLITLSLREFSPAQVVSARLLIGGMFLGIIVSLTGQSWRGLIEHWKWLLLVSVLNYAIPFFSVAWAQQTVPSSMTAIFMSGIPLFTLVLTRLVLGEAVSGRRWFGFTIGCAGLLWLAGANVLSEIGSSGERLPQLALLLACAFFALGSIIIRRMPRMPALPATALLLVMGGLMLLPFGGTGAIDKTVTIMADDLRTLTPALLSVAGLIFLALIPTGLGQFMRTFTIQSYGPIFYSIVGYLVPIWATVLGVLLLDETITLEILLAFSAILAGVVLAHDGGFRSPAPTPRPDRS